MHIEATQRALVIRMGRRFSQEDAARIAEVIATFTALSKLTLDFASTHEFQLSALFPLAESVTALGDVHVELHGLTKHLARTLRYLGVQLNEEGSHASAAAS